MPLPDKDPDFAWSYSPAAKPQSGFKDKFALGLVTGCKWVGGISLLYNIASGNIATPAQRAGALLMAATVYAGLRLESAFTRPKKTG